MFHTIFIDPLSQIQIICVSSIRNGATIANYVELQNTNISTLYQHQIYLIFQKLIVMRIK